MAGENMLEKLLDIIDDVVYDRNEVITYEHLSKVGKVHVNVGKKVLYHFAQSDDIKAKGIHVNYLVSGIQKIDNGEKVHKILIVPDKSLEAVKRKFVRLTSVHVYSIQKAQLQDDSSLYISHVLKLSSEVAAQKFSAVNYKNVEVLKSRTHKTPDSVVSHVNVLNKIKSEQSSSKAKHGGLFTLWQQNETQKKDNTGKTKEECKSSESSENKALTKQEVSQKKGNKIAKTKDVAYLFSKQSELQKKKSELPSDKIGGLIKSPKKPQERKQQDPVQKEKVTISTIRSKEKSSLQQKHEKKTKISVFTSSSSEESADEEEKRAPQRKLRRIAICSDSESDQEVVQDTNPKHEDKPNQTPPLPETPRYYKTVTKTYTDEDGFMVTKKVKECVSEPAHGDKTPVAKPTSPVSSSYQVAANVQPAIGHGPKKQTLLMSFFGKKSK